MVNEIKLTDAQVEAMDHIQNSELAVDRALAAAMNFAAQQHASLSKRSRAWWDEVISKDQRSRSWTYSSERRVIYIPKDRADLRAKPKRHD